MPAAWAVPTASERGANSQVAHKWARWLHNPSPLPPCGGGPNFVLATPRNIPPGVGYGWQCFPRDKFLVRV